MPGLIEQGDMQPVKGGEEPLLGFCLLAYLAAFFSENHESLLDQVARILPIARKAKDERMREALQLIVPPPELRDMIVRTQKIAQFPFWAGRRKSQFATFLAIAACILFLLVAGGLSGVRILRFIWHVQARLIEWDGMPGLAEQGDM